MWPNRVCISMCVCVADYINTKCNNNQYLSEKDKIVIFSNMKKFKQDKLAAERYQSSTTSTGLDESKQVNNSA